MATESKKRRLSERLKGARKKKKVVVAKKETAVMEKPANKRESKEPASTAGRKKGKFRLPPAKAFVKKVKGI